MQNKRARIWKLRCNNNLLSIVTDLFRIREVPCSITERNPSEVTDFMVLCSSCQIFSSLGQMVPPQPQRCPPEQHNTETAEVLSAAALKLSQIWY